jgi:hypothetical protein
MEQHILDDVARYGTVTTNNNTSSAITSPSTEQSKRVFDDNGNDNTNDNK